MGHQPTLADPPQSDQLEPSPDGFGEKVSTTDVRVDHVDRLPVPRLEVHGPAPTLMEAQDRDHPVLAHERRSRLETRLGAGSLDHHVERPSAVVDRRVLGSERFASTEFEGRRPRVAPQIDGNDVSRTADAEQFEHQETHVARAYHCDGVSQAHRGAAAGLDRAAERLADPSTSPRPGGTTTRSC
jgi:hypothetical protein